MLLSDGFNSCSFQTTEDLDQQLIRLTDCFGGGSIEVSPELEPINGLLYELPQTGLRVNAPLDATKISPGEPVTEQPAPQVSVLQTLTPATTEATTEKTVSPVVEFIKKNPLIVGGAAVAILFMLSRKK